MNVLIEEVTNPGLVTAAMLSHLFLKAGAEVCGFSGEIHVVWNTDRLIITVREKEYVAERLRDGS